MKKLSGSHDQGEEQGREEGEEARIKERNTVTAPYLRILVEASVMFAKGIAFVSATRCDVVQHTDANWRKYTKEDISHLNADNVRMW
jgi:hypothetical protein